MSEIGYHSAPTIVSSIEAKKDDSIPVSTVSVTEIREPSEEPEPQVPPPSLTTSLDLNAVHIQSSPYSDLANHLQLQDLGLQERILALAMTHFTSTRPDYATAPYLESFNWSAVFSIVRELCLQAGVHWQRREFYLVIFRSKLRAGADRAQLGLLDQMSHQEACASGGLLHYWFGSPDAERRNLATCIWRNRDDAKTGGSGPWHRKACMSARVMYDHISFHTHKFVVGDGAETWCLGPYRA